METVQELLARGQELVWAADSLYEGEFWRFACARYYEACLSTARALLAAVGCEAHTDDQVHRLLEEHFLSSGILDRQWGWVLQENHARAAGSLAQACTAEDAQWSRSTTVNFCTASADWLRHEGWV